LPSEVRYHPAIVAARHSVAEEPLAIMRRTPGRTGDLHQPDAISLVNQEVAQIEVPRPATFWR
jgi:hypothetical protein